MIRRIISRFIGEERGAVLVLVALGAVAMVGMLGLAIDLGMLYNARSEAQRAADAAALAGASAFIDRDPLLEPALAEAEARERLYEFTRQNTIRHLAIQDEEVTPEFLLSDAKVRVTIRRADLPLWFARVLGFETAAVAASATAEAAQAGSASCIKPFAIPDMWHRAGDDNGIWDFERDLGCNGNNCNREIWTFDPANGDSYDRDRDGYGTDARNGKADWQGNQYEKDNGRRIPLKINEGGGSPVASFWFPFVVTGRGGKNYKSALRQCIDANFLIGEELLQDSIETENGNMPKPTWDAIIDLIEKGELDDNDNVVRPPDPDAYWDEASGTVRGSRFEDWRESSRAITVAIFNPEDMVQGRTTMRLVDFGMLFLEDPRVVYGGMDPNHKAPITGRLVRFAPGEAGPNKGSLSRFLRLVE